MSTPARGRADYWKPGDWNALCYQCGRKRKAGDLMRYWQGYWLCPEHWESRQPQDFVRGVPDIQTAPWVQPPGLDGIPQLFVDIGDSEDTYTLTVSTSTVAAVNDTLVIITIMEGVYIGILDLTGLPAGWTVQLNNFGGVGKIVGTAVVRSGPPNKPLPTQIDSDASFVVVFPEAIGVLPSVSDVIVILLDINGVPVSDTPVTLTSTPSGTITPTEPVLTDGSGEAEFTFGSDDVGIYTLVASIGDAELAQQPTVTVENRDLSITSDIDVIVIDKAIAQYPDAETWVGHYNITLTGSFTSSLNGRPPIRWVSSSLFPASTTFSLFVVGSVRSRGGLGGNSQLNASGIGGQDGTDAIYVGTQGYDIEVHCIDGEIFAGGGGGAGGGGASGENLSAAPASATGTIAVAGSSGGGGAGTNLAAAGTRPALYSQAFNPVVGAPLQNAVGSVNDGVYINAFVTQVPTAGTAGTNATTNAQGIAGVKGIGGVTTNLPASGTLQSSVGGDGGDWGQAGHNSTVASIVSGSLANTQLSGTNTGGIAGKAFSGTVTNITIISGAANIKGSIG